MIGRATVDAGDIDLQALEGTDGGGAAGLCGVAAVIVLHRRLLHTV